MRDLVAQSTTAPAETDEEEEEDDDEESVEDFETWIAGEDATFTPSASAKRSSNGSVQFDERETLPSSATAASVMSGATTTSGQQLLLDVLSRESSPEPKVSPAKHVLQETNGPRTTDTVNKPQTRDRDRERERQPVQSRVLRTPISNPSVTAATTTAVGMTPGLAAKTSNEVKVLQEQLEQFKVKDIDQSAELKRLRVRLQQLFYQKVWKRMLIVTILYCRRCCQNHLPAKLEWRRNSNS